MSPPRKPLVRKLTRAYERGAGWNWVYWRAMVGDGPEQIPLASVPARYVLDVETGALTHEQAAHFLASRQARSLEDFTPLVPLWRSALAQLLAIRFDARRATLFGQAALDLAKFGKWFEAFEACWDAAEIERAYSGRVMRWRPLLYLLVAELVASGHDRADDFRVRSTQAAAARTARARHERRGGNQ